MGSPAERAFLQQVFKAEYVYVPSFLDTCDGVQKNAPTLVSSNHNASVVTIRNTINEQFRDVIKLAKMKSRQVPVVIVCPDPFVAKQMYDSLCQTSYGEKNAQLLLEMDPLTHGRMDYGKIVDNATKAIERNNPNGGSIKSFQITVTDLFGGRGHDYRINDEDVDLAGGLLMIALSIPESEREFIQWMGRTARSDRRGQYAVILNSEDRPLKGNDDRYKAHGVGAFIPDDDDDASTVSYDGHRYNESVVSTLLSLADKETEKNLNSLKLKILQGQRLNELCDKFYKKHQSQDSGVWPSGWQQEKLRDFLETGSSDFDAIAKLAVEVNLTSSEFQWKVMSAYNAE